MRDIKFKAWNKVLNKMYSHEELLKLTKDIVKNEFVTGIYLPLNSDIEILRYTGLKDKNEKEIYEGDIVEFYFDGIKTKSEVFYKKDKGFCFNISSYEYKYILNIKSLGFTDRETNIIGNIYENPELLKESE